MKKLILLSAIILSNCFAPAAMADFDMAKLKIHLTGSVANNNYFLCLSNNGCSRISAAMHGKVYYVDTGHVDFIFAASLKNMSMHSQSLPTSCQVNLNKDQTLTVTGNLIVKDNSPYINHLECTVT